MMLLTMQFAYAKAFFQLAIGLAVWVGFKISCSALLVVMWLIPFIHLGHPFWTGINPVFNESQLYKKLAILAAYLLIAISGAGCCSFDGWLLVKR
jgi:uncharacterized membrane protein YphA (DoxX/SURF4 family)